jgi:transposase-like protein
MSEDKARGRRGYPVDFKQRALNRLTGAEVSLRQVAREYKVSVPTLIKWRKETRADVPPAAAQQARADRPAPTSELERLRNEVEQLKQERDRLRQSIAILIGFNPKATP